MTSRPVVPLLVASLALAACDGATRALLRVDPRPRPPGAGEVDRGGADATPDPTLLRAVRGALPSEEYVCEPEEGALLRCAPRAPGRPGRPVVLVHRATAGYEVSVTAIHAPTRRLDPAVCSTAARIAGALEAAFGRGAVRYSLRTPRDCPPGGG